MVIPRICAMLESCTTDSPVFPPTLLYNEGWLLRFIIDWFSIANVQNHPLSFPRKARWYSEALMPSAFLARYKGDPLAESWTHADGAIGHFEVGKDTKTDLSLLPDAEHLVVLEAKIFSGLSSGVTNAKYYDQAARTVACVAEVLRRADRRPSNLSHLCFYVLAPRSQIDAGKFGVDLERGSIRRKVERRVAGYAGEKDVWYSEWFEPTFEQIEIGVFSWEDLIDRIKEQDSASANSIATFYERCLRFNQPAS